MTRSRRFRKLLSELRRLKKHFLPKQRGPDASYSQRISDHARAYRVLAHAEIEAYVEDVLREVVEKKYALWQVSKKPSYIITCLVTAAKFGWRDIESDVTETEKFRPPRIEKDDESISNVIARAFEQYSKIVEDNNGIRIKNIKQMIMPLGIALSDLDQTWLNYMESFGGKRGFVAHKSRLGMTVMMDPWSEYDEVQNLLQGLEVLDQLAMKALRSE
jgi:hypothetical protein